MYAKYPGIWNVDCSPQRQLAASPPRMGRKLPSSTGSLSQAQQTTAASPSPFSPGSLPTWQSQTPTPSPKAMPRPSPKGSPTALPRLSPPPARSPSGTEGTLLAGRVGFPWNPSAPTLRLAGASPERSRRSLRDPRSMLPPADSVSVASTYQKSWRSGDSRNGPEYRGTGLMSTEVAANYAEAHLRRNPRLASRRIKRWYSKAITDPEERERHEEDFERYAHFFRRAVLFAWRKRLFSAWLVWLDYWKHFKRCTANLMPYLRNYSLRNEIKPCFIDWIERTFDGIPGDTPQEKIAAIQAIRVAKLERERRAMAYEDRDSQIAPMLLTTTHGRVTLERTERGGVPRSLLFAPHANVCDLYLAELRGAEPGLPVGSGEAAPEVDGDLWRFDASAAPRAPVTGKLASEEAEAKSMAKPPSPKPKSRQKSR